MISRSKGNLAYDSVIAQAQEQVASLRQGKPSMQTTLQICPEYCRSCL